MWCGLSLLALILKFHSGFAFAMCLCNWFPTLCQRDKWSFSFSQWPSSSQTRLTMHGLIFWHLNACAHLCFALWHIFVGPTIPLHNLSGCEIKVELDNNDCEHNFDCVICQWNEICTCTERDRKLVPHFGFAVIGVKPILQLDTLSIWMFSPMKSLNATVHEPTEVVVLNECSSIGAVAEKWAFWAMVFATSGIARCCCCTHAVKPFSKAWMCQLLDETKITFTFTKNSSRSHKKNSNLCHSPRNEL